MRKTLKQYGGNMKEAKRRIDAWVRKGDVTEVLDLADLKLKILPELPENVENLDCDMNHLTSLPTLPKTLKELRCSYNRLRSLPSLPNTLEVLMCDNNKLESLPTLPNSLTEFLCFDNPLLPKILQPQNGDFPFEEFDYDDKQERILYFKPYIDRIRKLQKSRKNLTHNLTSHITEKKRLAFGNRPHKVLPTNVKRHISKYLNEDNLKNEDVHLYPTNIVSNIKRNNWRKTHKK
jgi:hypothetical protein